MDKHSLLLAIFEIMERLPRPEDRKVACRELFDQFKAEALQEASLNPLKQQQVEQKSLTNYRMKAFSGRLKDSLGRQRCFSNGKVVPCPKQAEAEHHQREPMHPVGEQPQKQDEMQQGRMPTAQQEERKDTEQKQGNNVSQAIESTESLQERVDSWLEKVQREAFIYLKEGEETLGEGSQSVLKVIIKVIANYVRKKKNTEEKQTVRGDLG